MPSNSNTVTRSEFESTREEKVKKAIGNRERMERDQERKSERERGREKERGERERG